MASSATLQVDYGVDTEGEKCSGVLFEIPTTEIIGGDVIDIRLWGMDFAMLAPYALLQGTASMGAGLNVTMPLDDIIEPLQFGNASTSMTTWSISSVLEIKAAGTVYYDVSGTPTLFASSGEIITNRFLFTDNYVTALDNAKLTGSVQVKYRSSQDAQELIDFTETNEFQCEWPIGAMGRVVAVNELIEIDQASGALQTWASIGEDVTAKFKRLGYSCLAVDDGTKLFGTVRFEYTRSPYFKLWQWTVPVGAQGQYWFFIYKDGAPKNKFSIQVPDLTVGLPEPRNIALKIVARDGGATLDGAAVYIDGMYMGLSDSSGILMVDGIMTGTHDLKVTKTGFVDTDKDTLWNDKLEVY
jgi:hypothetical protein